MNKCVLFLVAAMCTAFVSCSHKALSNEELIQQDALIGHWEALDMGNGFMLDFTYCNSFELRDNSDFAIYYWDSGKPDKDRVDVTWDYVQPDSLYFSFGGVHNVGIKITVFEGDKMRTLERNGDQFVLYKD